MVFEDISRMTMLILEIGLDSLKLAAWAARGRLMYSGEVVDVKKKMFELADSTRQRADGCDL